MIYTPATIKPEDIKINIPKPAPELTRNNRSQQTYNNMMANWKDGSFKMQQNNKIVTVEKQLYQMESGHSNIMANIINQR